MNETSANIRYRSWQTTGLIASALVLFALPTCRSLKANSPIPKGQVEIHVGFKGLSTDKVNKLEAFVLRLAEDHSAYLDGSKSVRDVGHYDTLHVFCHFGFVDQRYNPDHPIPSPEVEKAMRDRLESFFEDNEIDGSGQKFELRYGR